MKALIILIICLSVFYLTSSVGIQIKDANILDLYGRQIRFHGPNVVVKVPPYIPIRDRYDKDLSFSKEDMENMTKWGFNGIRLGMMYNILVIIGGLVYNQNPINTMKHI